MGVCGSRKYTNRKLQQSQTGETPINPNPSNTNQQNDNQKNLEEQQQQLQTDIKYPTLQGMSVFNQSQTGFQNCQSQYQDQTNFEILKLKIINENQDKEINDLRKKLEERKEFKQQFKEEQNQNQVLLSRISEIEQKKRDLEREVNSLKSEREDLYDEKIKNKRSKEELETQLYQTQENLTILERKLDSVEQENNKLKEKIKINKDFKKQEVETNGNIHQANLDQLQYKIDDLNKIQKQYIDDNKKLQSQLQAKSIENDIANDKFKSLKQKQEMEFQIIQELELTKINLENEIKNKQQENLTLNRKLIAQKTNIEELKRQIQIDQNNIKLKDEEIKDFQRRLTEAKEQTNILTMEFQKLGINADDLRKQLENQYKEKIDRLQYQLKEKEIQLQQSKEYNKTLETNLQRNLDEYKNITNKHERNNENIMIQHNEIEQRLSSIRSRLQNIFSNRIAGQVIVNLIKETSRLLNGTALPEFEKYENGNIKNSKFTIYKIEWDQSQIGKIIQEQKLYDLHSLAMNPQELGKFEVQLTMTQIGQNQLQQIKLFRVLEDNESEVKLKDKVFGLIQNKSVDCEMTSLKDATHLAINSAICDYYLKTFISEVKNKVPGREQNLIIGTQYLIKTQENCFYQAEILRDSQIVEYVGGRSEITNEQKGQFLAAFSYYTYIKSNKELLISYLATLNNNNIYNPYVCTKDGILSQVDLGITEMENIARKIECNKTVIGPYMKVFD